VTYFVVISLNFPGYAGVLYWSDTWSLTLREEHGLNIFGNRVVRKIFGQRRDEVQGDWRK
jgi:hypothetical protein